jgi:adenine-specific DNA-methyltransferase
MKNHQKLPRSGTAREALREKGQFWTPDWVAEAMVGYVIVGGFTQIFDPAVGAGAFFRAAKTVGRRIGRNLDLLGTEVFADALSQAREHGLSAEDLANVLITDFILNPPEGPFTGIVANPPYIRHHRLPADIKAYLKVLAKRVVGQPLDGRAGLHVFFLIRALERLAPRGRLAFIMPADTAEGVFAPTLWRWVTRHFRLDAVVTFDWEASPFPGVDTNPLVFMVTKASPQPTFLWAQCRERGAAFLNWTLGGLGQKAAGLTVKVRELKEGLSTGLSRPPSSRSTDGQVLLDFAKVVRGIATGANDYFFLTKKRAAELRIPPEFLVPAVGRTRDVPCDTMMPVHLTELENAGRPTLLFTPDARPIKSFPAPVREYLKHGEELKLPSRTLIASRHPWYKMETRPVPPYLFAYLGRRHARFIRNVAGVVPLTGFLCVYPRRVEPDYIERLWSVLNHADTIANIPLVGKSYGGGAIKVEPRALERLPLPRQVLAEIRLDAEVRRDEQLALFSA